MKLKIHIGGLSCTSCQSRAEKALNSTEGVQSAVVSLPTKTARVSGDFSVAELTENLTNFGFPPKQETLIVDVEGMHCASCVARIEIALTKLAGVISVHINLATQKVAVTSLIDTINIKEVSDQIERLGFTVSPLTEDEPTRPPAYENEVQDARWRAIVALALAAPVFLVEMGGHLVPALHHAVVGSLGQGPLWSTEFVLTTFLMLWPASNIYRLGIPNLLRRHPDMNSLVALGTLAAWGYSTAVLLVPSFIPEDVRFVYFEAAAVIIALILLGRWLEARARGKAGAAIQSLMSLKPSTALVWREQKFHELSLERIQAGDLIQARPGDRFVADGRIESGQTSVDESMISGESMPVEKTVQDSVIAGTLNGAGVVTYRAEQTGKDTALERIIAMVETAQSNKLPVQSLADRVVRTFVPAVLVIALLTLATWLIVSGDLRAALISGISVLIVACPCAMGLATPTSVMVGTARAAELGVLVRKGDALQTMEGVDLVILDKTGTLTKGEARLVSTTALDGWSEEKALRLAAAVESQSEHPLAQAFVTAAEGLDLPVISDVQAEVGLGIQARSNNDRITIGSETFLRKRDIDLQPLAKAAQALEEKGQTPIFMAVEQQAVALFGVADALRADAAEAIAKLHELGVATAMLTGDRPEVARTIAEQVGIQSFSASLTPTKKAEELQALRKTNQKVAFVGDGMNDAPSLANADVGIAMGSGTETAIESADVILTGQNLMAVPRALELSKTIMRNIRQNLFWAFAYNILLIPIAAGVLYPSFGILLSPMLGAAAMALSSVFVVSNALRLRKA